MVGSKAEKDHRRRVGKNWVMIGFWRRDQRDIDMLCQETEKWIPVCLQQQTGVKRLVRQ